MHCHGEAKFLFPFVSLVGVFRPNWAAGWQLEFYMICPVLLANCILAGRVSWCADWLVAVTILGGNKSSSMGPGDYLYTCNDPMEPISSLPIYRVVMDFNVTSFPIANRKPTYARVLFPALALGGVLFQVVFAPIQVSLQPSPLNPAMWSGRAKKGVQLLWAGFPSWIHPPSICRHGVCIYLYP